MHLENAKEKKNSIIADNLANNLCNKRDKEFWKQTQQINNKHFPLPQKIDNTHGIDNVCNMWKTHYNSVFNNEYGTKK